MTVENQFYNSGPDDDRTGEKRQALVSPTDKNSLLLQVE